MNKGDILYLIISFVIYIAFYIPDIKIKGISKFKAKSNLKIHRREADQTEETGTQLKMMI